MVKRWQILPHSRSKTICCNLFNISLPSDAYMRQQSISTLVQIMARCLFFRRSTIMWTNASLLLNGPLRTNFKEIPFKSQQFSYNKTNWEMSSLKWLPFSPGLNRSNNFLFGILNVVWAYGIPYPPGHIYPNWRYNELSKWIWQIMQFET